MKPKHKLAFNKPNLNYQIRPVEAKDLKALLDLGLQNPESLDLAYQQMQKKRAMAILVENEGEILAYGQINLDNKSGEICNLKVGEGYRNKGIGRAMIQYFVEKYYRPPIEYFEMGVHAENLRAYDLYLRLGFEEVYRAKIQDAEVIFLILLKN